MWLVEETAGSIRRIRRHGWNFACLALILAVGFGCVVGIFDIAYGVLHNPLPVRNLDRIVVANGQVQGVLYAYDLPNPHLNTVFEKSAEYRLFDGNLGTGQQARRIQVAMISPQFFPTLGIRMALGHDFSASDYHPEPSAQPWGHALPVVLSQELWRAHFGSDEAVLDKPIELNLPPHHFQVIGIAPPNATFPLGVDAWVPVHLTSFSMVQTAGIPEGTGGVIGLLKPGLSTPAAEAAIRAWPRERYFDSEWYGVPRLTTLVSLRDFLAGEVYPLSLRLWLASLFFLLLIVIAAATVFQTEAESRLDEFAIRNALGASPGRLLGVLGIETGLIVLLGLFTSFLIRFAVVRLTASYLSLPNGFQSGVRGIDLALTVCAAAVAFIASFLIQGASLFPKVRPRSPSVAQFRIPVQIIPATVIVIAAALLVRSAYKTMHIDPGVESGGVFVSEVSFPYDWEKFLHLETQMSPAERTDAAAKASEQFHKQTNSDFSAIVANLAKRPGVMDAGVISTAPYKGHKAGGEEFKVSSTAAIPPDAPGMRWVGERSMTPGAIQTLGMRLVFGQTFTGNDSEDEDTIVVNEALAEKIGPGPSALGQYVQVAYGKPARIVGIVGNVHEQDLFSEFRPTVYRPFSQDGLEDVDLVVRTSSGVSSKDAAKLMQMSVASAAPSAVVSHFRQLSEMVGAAGTLARYSACYLLALALLSVLLAGFCASSKTLGEFRRRKREIGIRMALGATRTNIIGLFVYSDLIRNAIAAFLGAVLAWWFSSLLNYLLYDVKLIDPISYSIGVATLIVSICVAQVLLLKKALRKNPRELI